MFAGIDDEPLKEEKSSPTINANVSTVIAEEQEAINNTMPINGGNDNVSVTTGDGLTTSPITKAAKKVTESFNEPSPVETKTDCNESLTPINMVVDEEIVKNKTNEETLPKVSDDKEQCKKENQITDDIAIKEQTTETNSCEQSVPNRRTKSTASARRKRTKTKPRARKSANSKQQIDVTESNSKSNKANTSTGSTITSSCLATAATTSLASTNVTNSNIVAIASVEKNNRDNEIIHRNQQPQQHQQPQPQQQYRSPFIVVKKDGSVNVINTTTSEDSNEKNTKTKNFNTNMPSRRAVRGFHSSTLSNKYDADTADSTWICVFCKYGPHKMGLGDLFGPYIASVQNTDNNTDSYREAMHLHSQANYYQCKRARVDDDHTSGSSVNVKLANSKDKSSTYEQKSGVRAVEF